MTPSARAATERRAARAATDLAIALGRLYDDASTKDVAAFGRDAEARARRISLARLSDSADDIVKALRDSL